MGFLRWFLKWTVCKNWLKKVADPTSPDGRPSGLDWSQPKSVAAAPSRSGSMPPWRSRRRRKGGRPPDPCRRHPGSTLPRPENKLLHDVLMARAASLGRHRESTRRELSRVASRGERWPPCRSVCENITTPLVKL
jgi:hypothetical protein